MYVRLKQKDVEWRKAKQELNRQWRDAVARNWEKSFDHRSFYFKQQDKKICTARHLVGEIKAGAEHSYSQFHSAADASGERETRATSSVDKEPKIITSAAAASKSADGAAAHQILSLEELRQAGLSRTIPTEYKDIIASGSQQLLLNYTRDEMTVHRDVYRIMCHAAEASIASSAEKERLAALWRDFLRVMFDIPVSFLYGTDMPTVGTGEGVTLSANAQVWSRYV
jgi:paired amphipathic helix protein Sin3a